MTEFSHILSHGEAINGTVSHALRVASTSCQIVSAYVKLDALLFIEELVQPNVAKDLLVRLAPSDITSGATDLSAIQFALDHNWNVYFHPRFHTKLYLVDRKHLTIGSANATQAGLGLSDYPNIETLITVMATEEDVHVVDSMFNSARLIDNMLFQLIVEQAGTSQVGGRESATEWDVNIWNESNPRGILANQIPTSSSPMHLNDRDVRLLRLLSSNTASIHEVRERFGQSTSYRWLKQVVEKSRFFGELTVLLHDDLLDDPKPDRRDVKSMVSTLLTWVEELEMSDFSIHRPNHSQQIRRKL